MSRLRPPTFPPRRLLAWLAAAALLLAGCGREPATPLAIVDAEAISAHAFLVSFTEPVGDGVADVASYAVRTQDGVPVPLVAAYARNGGRDVLLVTEQPQRPILYRVMAFGLERATRPAASGADTLEAPEPVLGSTVAAPVVTNAVALGNTTLLIEFGDPSRSDGTVLNDDALRAAAYRVAAPDLEVREVAFSNGGEDRSRVVLTTSQMDRVEYRVRVLDVTVAPDGRPLDPDAAQATFTGIAATDVTAPTVSGVQARDGTTVAVTFSEPVDEAADDPSRYTVTDGAGATLAVTDVALELHGTRAVLTTAGMAPDDAYELVVDGVRDLAGNAIVPVATPFVGVADGGDVTPPRVTGASSTGPGTVRVAFSEPVLSGAADPANYAIVGSDTFESSLATQSVLTITAATPSPDGTSVELETLDQSEILYTLTVTNVADRAGNPVTGPSRTYPDPIEFLGTAPVGAALDSDGDGLTDAAEQRGWTVTVIEANDTSSSRTVTSDPFTVDSDGDGLADADEKLYRIDPRAADSDADGLSDDRELNWIYSEPGQVDTDGDTLADGLEFDVFGISPIRADTDGDGFPDDLEIISDSRDPRVADLPRIAIRVGDMRLALDERFDYTDLEGTSQTVESSTSTTLEQGTERTFATSDTNTLASSFGFSQEISAGVEYEFPLINASGSVTVGSEQSQSEEYTSSVSRESATRSNEAYNESVARGSTFESSSEVTRTIEDASVQVALDLGSVSDVPFSATNLEITALWQDPVDPTRLVPVASLVPGSQLTSGDAPTFNLGPFVPDVGPIVFENREIFPQTVEQLLKAPRGLVFKVANYDILDEEGRNFAFSSRETYDVTAGIVIDDGTGDVIRERVSTVAGRIAPFADTDGDGDIDRLCGQGDACDNDGDGVVDDADRILFDANGRTVGITMAAAMERLGIDYDTADLAYDDAVDLDGDGTTDIDGTGVQIVYRVGNVETDAPNHEAWVLFYSREADAGLADSEQVPSTNFGDIVLRAGQTFTLAYLSDADEDRLYAREEYTYGSSDDWRNSDDEGGSDDYAGLDGTVVGSPCVGADYAFDHMQANPSATLPLDAPNHVCDTLGDYDEVKTGWLVRVRGETEYRSYASPRLPDSDADGLSDHLEAELGTDARQRDTDEDGISDFDEVYGFSLRFRGDDAFTDLTAKFCAGLRTDADFVCGATAENWVTDPLDPDTDGDAMVDGFEITQGSAPQTADAGDFVDTDRDGLSDSEEDAIGSSIYEPDTDGDGLPDLLESLIGTDPRSSQSDGDGLSDYEELDLATFGSLPGSGGFDADGFLRICGSLTYGATACAYDAPSGSGLPYGTNPSATDTDGDGLSDDVELLQPYVVRVTGEEPTEVTSDPTLANSDTDTLDDAAERTLGTDPLLPDTDGDGTIDSDEGQLCDSSLSTAECMDPLTPDQVVTVEIRLDVRRDGDVDVAGGSGEFQYAYDVSSPAGLAIEASGQANLNDGDASTVLDATFVTPFSESITVAGNSYEEDIDRTCERSISQTFDGEITSSSSFDTGEILDYEGDILAECAYTVYVDFTVASEP